MKNGIVVLCGVLLACVTWGGSTCVWSGGGTDANWSTAANWVDGVKPTDGAGDTVVLSYAGAKREIVNDLGAISLASLTFGGSSQFRLTSSEAITLVPSAEAVAVGVYTGITYSAACRVTNAAPLVLSGVVTNVMTLAKGTSLVQTGSISGTGTLCVRGTGVYVSPNNYRNKAVAYQSLAELRAANTHTGGTIFWGLDVRPYVVSALGPAESEVLTMGNAVLRFSATGTWLAHTYRFADVGGMPYVYFGGNMNLYGDWISAATAVFYILSNSGADVHIYGGFTFAGQVYPSQHGNSDIHFHTAVNVASFGCGSSVSSASGYMTFEVPGNRYGEMLKVAYCGNYRCGAANVLDGASYISMQDYAGNNTGVLDLKGFDQTALGVNWPVTTGGDNLTYRKAGHYVRNSSATAATLTLTGSVDYTCWAMLSGNLNLVWDPAKKATQTFRGRKHDITGMLAVRNGTLRADDAAAFPSLKKLEIGAGTVFELDSTYSNGVNLASLERLTIGAGGVFAISNQTQDALGTSGLAALDFDSAALMLIPDTAAYIVKNLKVNGVFKEAGDYTGDSTAANYLPQLKGKGTLRVLLASSGASVSWTGGAGDGKWSSTGNWSEARLPEDGDVVTLSGEGLPANGQMCNDLENLSVYSLTFEGSKVFTLTGNALTVISGDGFVDACSVDITNRVAIAMTPPASFVLRKTGSGGKFHLAGAFSGTAQLVLEAPTKGTYQLACANVHTGGVWSKGVNALELYHPQGCGGYEGFCVPCKFSGGLSFYKTGDYWVNFFTEDTDSVSWRGYEAGDYHFRGSLNGPNVADDRYFFLYNEPESRVMNFNFHGNVCFPKTSLYLVLKETCTVHWYAPVHFAKLWGGSQRASIAAAACYHATNTTMRVANCYSHRLEFHVDDPFPVPTPLSYECYVNPGESAHSGFMNLCGHLVGFSYLTNAVNYYGNYGVVRSFSADAGYAKPYLLLHGATNDAVTSTYVRDNVSICWNPAGNFTQTFGKRESDTSGSLIVSNGTLRVADGASFKYVREIVVGPTGRFLLESDAAQALKSVTNIVVAAGGVFEVAEGLANPFTEGLGVLYLETGSSFKMPAGACWPMKYLFLDGNDLDQGTYDATTCSVLSGGSLTCRSVEHASSSATWSHAEAAENEDVLTPQNWQGGLLPAFDRTFMPVFANAGTQALFSTSQYWKGYAVSGTDFTLAGVGPLSLREGGISVAANYKNTVRVPLVLMCDQSWQVGEGATLVMSNTVTSSVVPRPCIVKKGGGRLELRGEMGNVGAFTSGTTSQGAGYIYLYAPTNGFGEASDDVVSISGRMNLSDGDTRLIIPSDVNTVVERPVEIHVANSYYGFQAQNRSKVRFTKSFSWFDAARYHMNEGSRVIYEGGFSCTGWFCLSGSGGRITVTNKVANINYLYAAANTVDFAVAGNSVGAIDFAGGSSTTVRLCVAEAFAGTLPKLLCRNSNGVLDLAGNDQHVGFFASMLGGKITSADSAVLYFNQTSPITNAAVDVSGAITLVNVGTKLFEQAKSVTTTGGFGAASGTFCLSAACPNAMTLFATGSGRLELTVKNAVARNATLTIEDDGVVFVGESQRIGNLYVEGKRMSYGTYGSTTSGAKHVLPQLEGAGRIHVWGDGPGTAVIIR